MLSNQGAIITGGSRGIGRAIGVEMARAGADIALIYASNDAAAQETVVMIEALGRKARAYRCDVSDFAQAKDTVAAILKDFGTMDILVNNAGVVRDALILSMKESDFDTVLDTNLKGAFHMIRHLSSHLLRRKAGRILNIASVTGLMGNAGQSNYAAAKAGLIGMTKSVAREFASRGITCNAIAPGFIDTDMTQALPEGAMAQWKEKIPAGRMGNAEEIAHLAVFLASRQAAYITGEVIRVDGGLCM